MAMAAKTTIATVHEIVELGALDPEAVVTPGIFVQRVVKIPRVATTSGGFAAAATSVSQATTPKTTGAAA